jgi:hypothetical protein
MPAIFPPNAYFSCSILRLSLQNRREKERKRETKIKRKRKRALSYTPAKSKPREKERKRERERKTKRRRDIEKERKLLVAPGKFEPLKPGGRWRGLRTSGSQVLNCVLSNFCHLAWHLNLD